MIIEFHNKDYTYATVSCKSGTSLNNFTLKENERHNIEFIEPVRIAWWPIPEPISVAQVEQFGILVISSMTFEFDERGLVEPEF
jgi:hypothetical protein